MATGTEDAGIAEGCSGQAETDGACGSHQVSNNGESPIDMIYHDMGNSREDKFPLIFFS